MAGGPVMVEAAPPTIKVENHNDHQLVLESSLDSAILTGIQHYSIAVVATAALIPLLLLQSMGGTEPTRHGSSYAKSNRFMQPHRLRLVAAMAFCGTLLLAAGPVAADFNGKVYRTNGLGLNVRDAPNTDGKIKATLPEGTVVDISCQKRGQLIVDDHAWDYLPHYGGYASDYYLLTPYKEFAPNQPQARCP